MSHPQLRPLLTISALRLRSVIYKLTTLLSGDAPARLAARR